MAKQLLVLFYVLVAISLIDGGPCVIVQSKSTEAGLLTVPETTTPFVHTIIHDKQPVMKFSSLSNPQSGHVFCRISS